MRDWESTNIVTDEALIDDYMDYYEHYRAKCPVAREPSFGVMLVTGHPENVEVYLKDRRFSTCQALGGPLHPLPFPVEGDNIRAQVAEHRHKLPYSTHFITMDEEEHAKRRAIMIRFMTHGRLKENTTYMTALADRLIDEFVESGRCEVVSQFAQESGTLVTCELLGIPEEDRAGLVAAIAPPPGIVGKPENQSAVDPLQWLDKRFTGYLEERRCEPRGDILSNLASSKYPDGTEPPLDELARIASFTFVAGQDTTVKLMTWCVKYLCDYPETQDRLRQEPNKIADFVEEVLRLEAPTKQSTRTALETTKIGDVEVPAGTMLFLAHCAANRDPRVFENPDLFDIDRPNVREHLAFARGPHACPGAPLARMEGRVAVERFLARTRNLRISETQHGPPDARRLEREPTYFLNGLLQLHVEFDPA